MRQFTATAAILAAFPAQSFAVDETIGGGYSLIGSILQMFAALGIVVGLILVFYYVSNRLLGGHSKVGGTPRYIRLLETKFLAPKKSLMLVEVGGEYILMSSSGDGLQFIKQIDMMEEIEVLEGEGLSRLVPGAFHNKIIDLMARLPKRSDAPSEKQQSAGAAK